MRMWFVKWFALTSLACSSNTIEDRLSGRWYGDSIENVDLAQLPSATGWVKGTSFEFSHDKVQVTIPAQLPRTGLYRVLSHEGDTVTVEIQGTGGRLEAARFTLDTETQMRWHLGNGRAVVLQRAAP